MVFPLNNSNDCRASGLFSFPQRCIQVLVTVLGVAFGAGTAGASLVYGHQSPQSEAARAHSDAGSPIRYVIDLRRPLSHLVQVTMTVPRAQPGTQIQFPAWNNLYQIRDFVRNVQGLEARCDNSAQELARMDLNTWESRSEPCTILEIRYAVYANDESVFSSVLDADHAFLNFALLLFYLPQERSRTARVKFLLPEGWKLATLLEPEGEEFTASDYDALADSPAEAGRFEEYEFDQGGATYRVVVEGDPSAYSPERLVGSLKKITAAETGLMQDVPFSKYTFILHFSRPGSGGGMEHRNGTAISIPAENLRRNWEGFEATAAHEFFHLWNVKRIRPQGLEPIDYQHGNDTRELWFSEGVTTTYQELVLLRAGMISRRTFYEHLTDEIQRLEERPARRFQSVEQSGREAWLEKYTDYFRPDRSVSYYNKGALLGFVLDLAIRHATHNRRGLDDLMRRLNQDFARRGRFFTQSDLLALVRELAPEWTGAGDFFRDYLSGRRELDYCTYLGFAGLRLETRRRELPAFGFLATQSFDGAIQVESVEPGSNAGMAGLTHGDVLIKMNGKPLLSPPEDELFRMKPGHKVRFKVRRGKQTLDIAFNPGRKTEVVYLLEEIEHASPDQLQVRRGWLEGKTE